MANECPDCATTFTGSTCPGCGFVMPASIHHAPRVPSLCPMDGGRLQADGWCETGQGYLVHMACPFACPICRQPLGWAGQCYACHGTTTGRREDWTMTGDRYEFEDGHWKLALKGPRKACSIAENMADARQVQAILGKAPMLTPAGDESRTRVREAIRQARELQKAPA